MTREEREDAIAFFEDVAKREVNNAKYSKLAIEALKQEPILDKIRSEVERIFNDRPSGYNHNQRTEFYVKVLQIIDKYKEESEDKDE